MIDLLRGENIGEDGALRTHWAFFDGILPSSSDIATYYLKPRLMELYKAFKKDECLTYATQYASSLESAFLAIKETQTQDKTDELKNSLDRVFGLNRAFTVPLIICAWIKTQKDPAKLMQLLNSVERFIIRYQGFQRKRSRIEERFYAWSNSLYQGKVDFTATVSSIDQLCRNNAPDTSFRSALESPAFYNIRPTFAVKLLFFELEKDLRRKQKQGFEIPLKEWLSEKFHIEHIWAQSYMIYGGYLTQEYDSYQKSWTKIGQSHRPP